MKKIYRIFYFAFLLPLCSKAQSYEHYTMFMYNMLQFNPAYAGSMECTSVNATYRDQWTGIPGAPRTANISIDRPMDDAAQWLRYIALGLSVSHEELGVERNTDIIGYFSFRKIEIKNSILSLGLRGGGKLYSAYYNDLNPYQVNDPNLAGNLHSRFLPNFGAGAYWNSGDKYFLGASIPNLLESVYDPNGTKISSRPAHEINSYYLSGGAIVLSKENFKLKVQAIGRYAQDKYYKLPLNADGNLSAIMYDRFLLGATYRTDKSLEAIVQLQVTSVIRVGYSYDYFLLSPLYGYTNGSHEIVVGFNFKESKYINPRFPKNF